VLPHLNETQTEEAIEAIYRRFPDTGTLASGDRDRILVTDGTITEC
jgi:hypothetical protein